MAKSDPFDDPNFLQDFLEGSYWLNEDEVNTQVLSEEELESVLDDFREEYNQCFYQAQEDAQGSMGTFTNENYDGVIDAVVSRLHEIATFNEKRQGIVK